LEENWSAKMLEGGITYLQKMVTALHGCDNKST
jgi:hypothetical protein